MKVAVTCLLTALVGCAAPATAARPVVAAPTETWGLRVSISTDAKSVCVFDDGCAGSPKGAIQIRPLEPSIREAVSQALVAAGFELVDVTAERDVLADVEWRGTDTLSLRLQDAHGRLIDQASYRRSLDRCRDLPELTWDKCWAANFGPMKEALAQPLRESPAVRAFAQKGEATPTASAAAATRSQTPRPPSDVVNAELDAVQLQETVARYREELQRACWQPALEAREPTASSSARVSTTLLVDPSGQVADVTAMGDPLGYPRLASCIVSQVRHWRFPKASGPTRVNIPFVFASD